MGKTGRRLAVEDILVSIRELRLMRVEIGSGLGPGRPRRVHVKGGLCNPRLGRPEAVPPGCFVEWHLEMSSGRGASQDKPHRALYDEAQKPSIPHTDPAEKPAGPIKFRRTTDVLSLKPSGALYKEQLTVNDTLLKYAPPADAADKPDVPWVCVVFKDNQPVETMHLRRDHYLFGRDKNVCSILLMHESISKQHAVVQFRRISMQTPYGHTATTLRPYVIDLESANSTFLNERAIEPARFYEICEKDVVKFGASTREYIFLVDREP